MLAHLTFTTTRIRQVLLLPHYSEMVTEGTLHVGCMENPCLWILCHDCVTDLHGLLWDRGGGEVRQQLRTGGWGSPER